MQDITLSMVMKKYESLRNNPIANGIRADINAVCGIMGRMTNANKDKLKDIALRIHKYLKGKGIKRLNKTLMGYVFFNGESENNYRRFDLWTNKDKFNAYHKNSMRRNRAKARLIKYLIETGKAETIEQHKSIYSMTMRTPYSFDYGSYKAMMEKNGYKKRAFIYDGIKRVYLKNNMDIDNFDMSNIIIPEKYVKLNLDNFEYDVPTIETEIYSNKPRNKQAVYTRNKFSIVRSKKAIVKKQLILN